MKDGVMVRTIEELRQHFDAEKLLLHFMNGKLQKWLSERHYSKYVEDIEKLDINDDILTELCGVLEIDCSGVSTPLDISKVEKKNEKLTQIKKYTDSKEVLDNLHLVAMNQTEFETMLKSNSKTIYLFGKVFTCPDNLSDITIEGINNPTLILKTTKVIDFKKVKVVLRNITFDSAYQQLIKKQQYEDEHRNDKKRNKYQPSSQFDYKLSDSDRQQSKKLFAKLQDSLIDVKFDVDVNTRFFEKLLTKANLENSFSIDVFGSQLKRCLKKSDLDCAFQEFKDRIK